MGTPYIGSRKDKPFTKESVRGVAQAYSAGDWQPHLGFDFKPVVEKIKDDPAIGRIETNSDSAVIKKSSEGSVPLRLTKEFAGHILNMIFGKAPSTTGSGTYTHVYTVQNTNSHLSYTVHVKDPIKGLVKYPLVLSNEITLDFKLDDMAKATLALMGGGEASASGSAPSYSVTDSFFVPKNIEVRIADTFADVATGTIVYLDSLSLNIAKNVVKEFALGSETPIDMINQKMGVGVALTTHYEDTMLRDLAHNNAKKAMQIKITDGTAIITIVLPRVGFEDWSDTNDNGAYLKNTVACYAERDNTNGLIQATLVNTVASY